jgi:hypothetical protein
MKKITKKERRIHPRLAHRLPFKVAADGYDFTTSTENISCVGAYCHIDKYVPPFTRVMIKLDLPINVNAAAGGKSYNLECKGVIVRSEDEDKGGFNVAIFFNAIRDDQRRIISRYINRFLPEQA